MLSNIRFPEDLKKIPLEKLPGICEELRAFLINSISKSGGHFSGNLGVVELTVALHYVFDFPSDSLIWDVGHQSYGHKFLTGRKDQLEEIRKFKGISGFPKMSESIFDMFGTGHSSTSISASLGMAVADKFLNKNNTHIAVIGDGALSAGQAFEALNNAKATQSNLLVIVNDNSIGIDPATGAIHQHFLDLKRKSPSSTSNYFEILGLEYLGITDGHNVINLVKILEAQKSHDTPRVLHCVTVKGKGYEPAEQEQTKWHSTSHFDKISGKSLVEIKADSPLKFQDVFGKTLTELAEKDHRIMAVTPAMISGSGLNHFQKRFPERLFDVGIAEQHAVTFSAGLAAKGLIPFCSIYSTFAQRAYDQIIHDVCLQNLPVIFCIDRAGLVGEDGPTHHGNFDISFLNCIPNIIISAPANEHELRDLMYTAQHSKQPFVIRYPRGNGFLNKWENTPKNITIGKFNFIRKGEKTAVISVGNFTEKIKMLHSNELSDLSFTHIDARFIKPLDEESLHHVFQTHSCIITYEDGSINGGFGSMVSLFKSMHNYSSRLIINGIPDEFITHGSIDELRESIHLDDSFIAKNISENY